MVAANNRHGAEVLRMRSMWDSIETHCWPIDRLAAIVVSSGAYCGFNCDQDDIELQIEKGAKLTVQDVLDVTRPPPKETLDKRGLRTRHYAIVGFSHKVPIYRRAASKSSRELSEKIGYGYKGTNFNKDTRVQNGCRAVWFVLRSDGAVINLNTKYGSAMKLLNKKEINYLESRQLHLSVDERMKNIN